MIMVDVAMAGRSDLASTTNKVRPSSTTDTPDDETGSIFKEQQVKTMPQRMDSRDHGYLSMHDTQKRSYSLRSDCLQAQSTPSTDENSSSEENRSRPRFGRNDSSQSSVPTSPEEELTGRKSRKNSWSVPVVAAPVEEPRMSSRNVQAQARPVVIRGRQQSIRSLHSSTLSNRNKPLPIPRELLPDASPFGQSPSSTSPLWSISPAANTEAYKFTHRAAVRPAKSTKRLAMYHSSETGLASSSVPPQHDGSPSPHASQERLHSHASQQEPLSEVDYLGEKHSAFKSAHPFRFHRGNSWLGGSKYDYIQERHLKAPPATWKSDSQQPPSPLSSSSSSHSSCGHEVKPTKLSPNYVRPLLLRHRSKSMDILRPALATSDSIPSRFSRLLSRKPSKSTLHKTLPVTSNAMLPPKVPDKDDAIMLGYREGTLSRLTGSLLRKRSTASSIKASFHAATATQEALPCHQRKHSIECQGVHVHPQSDLKEQGDGTRTLAVCKQSKPTVAVSMGQATKALTSAKQLADMHLTPFDLESDVAAGTFEESARSRESSASHSRNQSNDMDDFFSVASMTPSTSNQGHAREAPAPVRGSGEGIPIRSKRISLSRRSTPPSAFREYSAEGMSTMTESEKESNLLDTPRNKEHATSMQAPQVQLPRRVSLSSIDNDRSGIGLFLKPIARADTMLKASKVPTAAAALDVAVSDTEDEPLPAAPSLPPVASKRRASEQSRRDIKRQLLHIDVLTSSTSSADGKSTNKVPQRRPSLATLSIADDLEFLQALEHVRKVNQVRIKKKDEEAIRVEQMARLGMASVNRRAKGQVQAQGVPRTAPCQRPSSAQGRINSSQSNRTVSSDEGGTETPSALELGVGKASGKMQDGAFINDDDWKKEVKALFIIREIVLTERSYARHLQALLQAVRALCPTVKKGRSSGVVPGHITMMRRLLPQLIALSHGLADRIDANPTAAGVGTAFRLVHSQMEASYIAWSSVAIDIMDALRVSEKAKGKTKDRIGLIALRPIEHLQVQDRDGSNAFMSVPSSPTTALAPLLAAQDGPRTTSTAANLLMSDSPLATPPAEADGREGVKSRVTRRRSTLSGLSPSLTASLRSMTMTSLSSESKGGDEGNSSTTPPSSLARRAREAMVSPPSTKIQVPSLPASMKPRSGSFSHPPLHKSSLTPASSIKTTSNTPTSNSTNEASQGKSLSAMDVAIMPTQRLLRYLLLLRDLNMNTPPQSLSHIRLQRCLDSVAIIATHCDKASSTAR